MNFSSSDSISTDVPHTVYQIDFASANCGKIVPMSKRRIRFKFGYTNMPAIYDGLVGQDCRGAEHEVSVTWSLSSGKQTIKYDGEVIYFNVCDMSNGKMTYSWHDKAGHYLKVVVHSMSTSLKQTQDAEWKQYDLFIDGVSYFRAPQIYELGVFTKSNQGDAFRMDSPFSNNAIAQAAPSKHAVTEQTKEIDLLSFDDIPVTPTEQVATVTPTASPHDNAILLPFMGMNTQQQYTNYAF